MPRLSLNLPQVRRGLVSVFQRHPSHIVRVPCVARDSQRCMAVHVVFPRSLASHPSPDTTGQSSRLCQPRLLAQTGLGVLACLVLLAGCGGSGKPSTPARPSTATVEHQFAVCIVEAAYMGTSAQPDCDPTTLAASPYVAASVLCTHKGGNEYVCQASAPSEDSQIAAKVDGSYDVTYDGRSIAWQASG